MRCKALFGAALTSGVSLLAVVGCYSDRHKLSTPQVEEYKLPPDEARFNNPPTEGYRKPPVKKEEKTLLGRPGPGGGPLGATGF
jgi:hypothetical protein